MKGHGHAAMAFRREMRYIFRAMEKLATEPNPAASDETEGDSLDIGDVRLAWGNPTRWKARWREESLQKHLDLPVGERLRRALSLLIRRSDRGG